MLRPILRASDRRPASEVHAETVVRFGEQARAQRFTIHTRLRYRTAGEWEWHEGTMVNISKSGVLFEADRSARPSTAVEMAFSLPAVSRNEGAAEVVCRGVIVRAISDPESGRPMALAARVSKFQFGRAGRTAGTAMA